MYVIYADGQILHYPLLDTEGRIVNNPVLSEKLNAHGSLKFTIVPTNPLYNSLEPRNTKIKVVADGKNRQPWFGRVMSVKQGWNNCLEVYCEGEMGCLNDSHYAPFGFKGAPSALFANLVNAYNGSRTNGYTFAVGNVSVTDPNNYIVRSSNMPKKIWPLLKDSLFGSSLGGYILPRYDERTDTHYLDYLALDENDPYAITSSQVVKFGTNLLDFKRFVNADEVVTVLVPYGTQLPDTDPNYQSGPPENGTWNGNRLRIDSVNQGRVWIENADGIAMWGRISGFKIWDDVTVAQNLLNKATAWLAQQIWSSVTLDLSAVDLANLDADMDQIQIGEYVRCQSKPHSINVLMLCTEKTTYLTQLERSSIVLGAGQKTISDLQAQSVQKEDMN